MQCFAPPLPDSGIKIEDNSDQYWFGDLLKGYEEQQEQFFDQILNEHQKPIFLNSGRKQTQTLKSLQTQIIEDVSSYLCLRTSSMAQILDYIQQYSSVPLSNRKSLVRAIKKHKLKLKRQHAKYKANRVDNCSKIQTQEQQQVVEIKQEIDSPIMQGYSEGESQETKKKKRNRMSAQNSRDRKKQYIKSIEDENVELRQQIARHKEPSKASKTFLKHLLCLGIANLTQEQPNFTSILRQNTHDDMTEEEKAPFSQPNDTADHRNYLNLARYQNLLSLQQQELLKEVLDCLEIQETNQESKVKAQTPKTKRSKKTSETNLIDFQAI